MKKILFVLVLNFAACAENSDDDYSEFGNTDHHVKLHKSGELILQNNIEEDYPMGRLRYSFVTTQNRSEFIFYDEINRQFFVANNSGNVERVISREGRGPGELSNVTSFAINEDDELIVYDGGQLIMKKFEIHGERFTEFDINQSEFAIVNRSIAANNDRFYAPILKTEYFSDLTESWQSGLVGVFNYEGSLIEIIGQYDSDLRDGRFYSPFPLIAVDFNKDLLFSSHTNDYRIQVTNLNNGERVSHFGIKSENFRKAEDNISQFQAQQEIQEQSIGLSFVGDIYLTENYVLLHFENVTEEFYQTRDHNEKNHFLKVYDRKTHEFYNELELPYIIGSVADNDIYLIEDDNPENYTIGVYEILTSDL